ncbi:hypothetical protein FACS1894172_03040 [Spirochaetia bacterium]|nr:hypothetical protein FACS1894164_19400 [Spirochaetia bacterium]GHU30225.1 hypothetical protein FACS1894172_03040 [Spirochaetia bacterium]
MEGINKTLDEAIRAEDIEEVRSVLKFFSKIKNARDAANSNTQGLKDFLAREIERLDNALKEAIKREEDSVKSQEAIEQKIEENKAKAEWLNKFIAELNTILEV